MYQNSTTGQNYKQLFSSVSQPKIFSPIFRLQTGHGKLNFHFEKVGLLNTGLCLHYLIAKDVVYFFLV